MSLQNAALNEKMIAKCMAGQFCSEWGEEKDSALAVKKVCSSQIQGLDREKDISELLTKG